MRWWINTDHDRMCVDNAVISGLDFSALASDIWMIQWTDGKGEIERQVDPDTNDNGLREKFIDILPYCGYFQDFLALCPRLTLVQAQAVQIDLIGEVYNSKRQEPYCYEVAAGDYCWDATDGTLFSSTAAGLQSAIGTLNSLIDKVNELASAINANVVDGVNARVVVPGNSTIVQANAAYAVIVDGVNNHVVAGVNGLLLSLAAEINGGFAGIASEIASNIVGTGNSTITYINDTILGVAISPSSPVNTINNRLTDYGPGDPTPNLQGLVADIVHVPYTFAGVSTYGVSNYSITGITGTTSITAAMTNLNSIPWTTQGHVPVAVTEWIPVGGTEPVPVTPDEQAAILAGISARTADLNVTKNVKIAEVKALTVIQDVIDYDVTSDW